jgi:hypothetical protein
MATAAEIQTAYKAFYRTDLNATVAASIASSGVSLDSYIASLNAQTASTTSAAVAIASFVTGVAPTSAKLDALKAEADKQVASYTALGVADPALGAFEAFGRSFATDADTTAAFSAKYGSLSTADFIGVVYGSVYGATPSTAALANLTGQIDYFTKLYTANNVPNAALAAKGAVLGQIVGYAFTSDAANNSNFDNQVATLLSNIAKGDVAGYGKALPAAVNPGSVGVTITLPGATTDVVGPNVADPALKSTANNDTIQGTFVAGAKIDAGAGADVANLTVGAGFAAAAGTIVNVETINVTTSGAVASGLDLGAITGYTTVGFVDGAAGAAGSLIGLAAGTALTVTDTDPTATAMPNVTFALKTQTAADVANITVNGLNSGQTVTLTGYETINLTASGANSTTGGGFGLIDNDAKALNITATKSATIALTATALESVSGTGAGAVTLTGVGNTVKTIDFSGSSGANTIDSIGTGTTSIKGGSGVDTFGATVGVTKSGTVVDLGAGNDYVKFALAAGTDTATVTGGTGADQLVLGLTGKVTVVYTSQADSTNANYDVVSNFDTGADKINLAALNLAGDKTGLGTFNTATALAQGNAIFGGKAVAYGTANGTQWLVADINNNGVFDVNDDMIVNLTGLTAPVIGDIIFA